METEIAPVVVDFPLRGEWVAAHTPAERVPSHGTDQLGQRYRENRAQRAPPPPLPLGEGWGEGTITAIRAHVFITGGGAYRHDGYAYDFLRIERGVEGWKFFGPSNPRYLLFGVRLDECLGWSDPILAPFDGEVVTAWDGWPERPRLHLLSDLAVVLRNGLAFDPARSGDLRRVLGNHVILKMAGAEVYAFFAHARRGSLRVAEGEAVRVGDHLADVGHSGNSTAPHLHFHLMDGPDILRARGLPCRFRAYRALRDGVWCDVVEGMPGKREFVRYPD